ncbi:MAG: PEPxxWA-CTERM sorting domain-containing protein [Patescibacteria group bacterium]
MAGATFALAFVCSQAAAATYVLKNVELPSSYRVHVTGPGVDKYLRMGDQLLTFEGLNPFLAFCLDVYHNAKIGAQTSLYADGVYESPEYGGFPVSIVTMKEINGLLHKAALLADNDPNRDYIQGGIWAKQGNIVTSTNATVQAGIDFWAASTYQVSGPIFALESIPTARGVLRQAYASPVAVPEPATWALMIGGFGGAGVMLRRRRATLALT